MTSSGLVKAKGISYDISAERMSNKISQRLINQRGHDDFS